MNKTYRFLQIVLTPFYKLFFRLRAVGLENELPDGPCIICANHISMHDIFFIAASLKRQIYFFAKKELFKNPLLAKFLRSLGTVSVNRGHADLHSITQTISTLREGKTIGIFPQGTRMPGKELAVDDAKSGIGLMAYRAKSNVLPIYIQTKHRKVRLFRKVTVIVGKPILYDELGFTTGGMAEYDAATKLIFGRICELAEAADAEVNAHAD